MKLYFNYFKLRIITFLQYREAAIAGLATQVFWGLMMTFIYMALYENSDTIGMNFEQVVSYVWLHQAFFAFLSVRTTDSEIRDAIRSGDVAYEIIRPYNLYFWWYIKTIAKRVAGGLLRVGPVIVLAALLPSPYGIMAPASFTNFILFIISLVLGALVVSGINVVVYSIGFYTYNEAGISSMLNSIMELLCGAYVPVAFLPLFIQKGSYYLPFRLVSDLPYRIYSNNIDISEGMFSIGLQVIWIIILIYIGNMIVNRSLKKVFVQGG